MDCTESDKSEQMQLQEFVDNTACDESQKMQKSVSHQGESTRKRISGKESRKEKREKGRGEQDEKKKKKRKAWNSELQQSIEGLAASSVSGLNM